MLNHIRFRKRGDKVTIYQCIYNEISDRVHHKQYESKEYAELVDVYGVTIHNLEATLTDEQRHLFFEGEAQRNLIAAEDEEQMFQCGFVKHLFYTFI